GPERGPELGIIRTEELLAARQLDGARQFFTRAYDFGFSKTADETFRFWPRDSLFADVLAVIRRFQPPIVVSSFSGPPRDGHGQHQVAGIVATQAFEALRDSTWGPVKLYRAAWSDTSATTLRLDGGALDPLAGRSYHQIAMAGRSRHRSQDMGQFERAGPSVDRLAFVEWRDGRRGTKDGDGLFAGGDTVLPGRARHVRLLAGKSSDSTARPRPCRRGRSPPGGSPSPSRPMRPGLSPISCGTPSPGACTTGRARPPTGAACLSSLRSSRWPRGSPSPGSP